MSIKIPNVETYWLKNAHIPLCLWENSLNLPQTREHLVLVDIQIHQGKITQINPHQQDDNYTLNVPVIDLKKKIIFPWFVDIHTHLDKGHIWERAPNPDGTFNNAIAISRQDAAKNWHREDLYRRMDFGLQCSYAHGTKAIRTHIDSYGEQAHISFEVFLDLQKKWADKIILQAVCLVSLDYFATCEGLALADKMAAIGGILGGVAYMNPDLDSQLDYLFSIAKERNLDLDFHVDETDDPNSRCLYKIAKTAIRQQFKQQILCGHCCSLAVQTPEVVNETLDLVKEANISIVSLPMCNLYLQGRNFHKTPLWRGVTLVHEIKEKNIPLCFASDNCRDPFHGFGDHNLLEVFSQAVKIAHLDTDYRDWIATLTKIPASLMKLDQIGTIKIGLPADLIIFKARYFSELLSRLYLDRVLLINGKPLDVTLPDYDQLDY